MIEFKVSAPGKVILFGEHSVVHGMTAIAGSLNLRTILSFKELSSDQDFINLSLQQTKLYKSIAIEKVQDFFFSTLCPKYNDNPERLLKHVQKFVELIEFDNNSQKFGLEAIFYLFVIILQHENLTSIKPFKIHVETELSIGAGLGSSASFAVCIATCFSHYTRLLLQKETSLDEAHLQLISQYAFDCEKIMHGIPSGVDNTICTFGSIIEFRKNECLNLISCTSGIKIMLVDTKVQRSTKALVENVNQIKVKFPSVFEHIFKSMDNVAKESLNFIKRIQNSSNDYEAYKELANLMNVNQGLLYACGVSHPSLDIICMESRNCGLIAKLTGAGGGGYAYVLIPPDTPNDNVIKLSNRLAEHGFIMMLTKLGGYGVKIH